MRNMEDYTNNYMIESFESYQVKYRKKKLVEILEKYKPQHILEIGCGMKPIFLDYEGRDGEEKNYTIIEPSEIFYNNAVKLSESRSGIECMNEFFGKNEASAEKLGNQFDFIICSSLLHEIENTEEMINDMIHCCNQDTIIHINVPNAYSMHRLLAQESQIISDVHEFSKRNNQLQQNHVFDLNILKEVAIQSGLEVIEEGSYFVKPFSHGQMNELLKAGIIDEKVLDGFYSMSRWMPEYGSEIFVNCKVSRRSAI